ncbi:hypothetical protein KXW34_007011, partial [Aspergillus fumigatus]
MDPSHIPTTELLTTSGVKDNGFCVSSPGRTETLCSHPLDQLSPDEIRAATQLIRDIPTGEDIKQGEGPRPDRRAFAILIDRHSPGGVIEAVINLTSRVIEEWKRVEDVMPILTPTDLGFIERVARSDPRVIQACQDIGIYDMSQVYFDAWAIGIDERWGRDRRLQQGLPYYR